MFISSSRNKFALVVKLGNRCFLLVSVRHVGAHPDGPQHGVSIQIFMNLGKKFLPISRIRNIPQIWILARVFVYEPPFIFQILYSIYWTVLILILICFEWRDTENRQFNVKARNRKEIKCTDLEDQQQQSFQNGYFFLICRKNTQNYFFKYYSWIYKTQYVAHLHVPDQHNLKPLVIVKRKSVLERNAGLVVKNNKIRICKFLL